MARPARPADRQCDADAPGRTPGSSTRVAQPYPPAASTGRPRAAVRETRVRFPSGFGPRPTPRGRAGAVARPPDVATCSARAPGDARVPLEARRVGPYGPTRPPGCAPGAPTVPIGLWARPERPHRCGPPNPPDAPRRPAPTRPTYPRPPTPTHGTEPPRRLLSVTIRPARSARPSQRLVPLSPYRRTRPDPGARPPGSTSRRPDGPADGTPPGSTGPPRPDPARSPPRPPPKPLTAAPRGPRSPTRQARRQASRPSVDMDLGERRRTV